MSTPFGDPRPPKPYPSPRQTGPQYPPTYRVPVPPPSWPGPPPPARTPPRWPLAVGMLALGVLLGVSLVVVTGSVGMALNSLTMKGSMTLNSGAGPACRGTGGFNDIRPGASVTVRDADGTIVATGQLDEGTSAGYGSCTYPFTVRELPRSDFYSVEVTHRGQVTFPRDAVERGAVSLSLGT